MKKIRLLLMALVASFGMLTTLAEIETMTASFSPRCDLI